MMKGQARSGQVRHGHRRRRSVPDGRYFQWLGDLYGRYIVRPLGVHRGAEQSSAEQTEAEAA